MTFKYLFLIYLFIPSMLFSIICYTLLTPKEKGMKIFIQQFILFWILNDLNIYFISNKIIATLICFFIELCVCKIFYLDHLKKLSYVCLSYCFIQILSYFLSEVALSYHYSIVPELHEYFSLEFSVYAFVLYGFWLLVLSFYLYVYAWPYKRYYLFYKYMTLSMCQFIFIFIIFLLCIDYPFYIIVFMVLIGILVLCYTNTMMVSIFKKINMDFVDRYALVQQKELKRYENDLKEYQKATDDDIKNIKYFIKNHLYDQAHQYIDTRKEKIKTMNAVHYCEHRIIDLVLCNKIKVMEENHIKSRIDVILNEDIKILDLDIVTLLFNVLDNAIEACLNIEGDRYIIVRIYMKYSCLYLEVSNSKDALEDHSDLRTTKKDTMNHGIGISIIKGIAKKYDGDVLFKDNGNSFKVKLFLKNR